MLEKILFNINVLQRCPLQHDEVADKPAHQCNDKILSKYCNRIVKRMGFLEGASSRMCSDDQIRQLKIWITFAFCG